MALSTDNKKQLGRTDIYNKGCLERKLNSQLERNRRLKSKTGVVVGDLRNTTECIVPVCVHLIHLQRRCDAIVVHDSRGVRRLAAR